ncbi:MAG: twin-arginine translocase TatA/TatE family subunit [Gemmatimonadetes bacterium]|nr:twin-arginine translocase TatA/TatE family subunit [Gemmatimonadota bacterium]
MIGGLGFGELVLVFAVLLLLFGAKRLPELASGMGKGIRDFKRSVNGLDDNSLQSHDEPNSIAPGETRTAAPVQHLAEAEPKRLQD